MEIYHRDHWIIIVYLTTWNDLNMGIEENNLTDLVIREDRDQWQKCSPKAWEQLDP